MARTGSGSSPLSPAPPVPHADALGDGGLGDKGDRGAPRWLTTREAAESLRVNRKTLDALSAKYPDVSGGPVNRAVGNQRRHLLWPAETLEQWWREALEAHHRPARPAPRVRRAQKTAAPADDGPVDWRRVARGKLSKKGE